MTEGGGAREPSGGPRSTWAGKTGREGAGAATRSHGAGEAGACMAPGSTVAAASVL